MSDAFTPVRLLVADDQALFRSGLARVLADWPDIHVVSEAADGLEAVAKAKQTCPDVVILDINMPRLNGLDALRRILQELPETRVVMLTVSEDDADLFRALKLGAHGYLLKNMKPEMLYEMLMAVTRGETPLSPLMARKMLDEFARLLPLASGARLPSNLTPREKEVLALLAGGAGNQEIADQLCLTPGTVKRHVHSILAKLHLRSRGQVIAYAVRQGITSPD